MAQPKLHLLLASMGVLVAFAAACGQAKTNGTINGTSSASETPSSLPPAGIPPGNAESQAGEGVKGGIPTSLPIQDIQLPDGFRIDVVAVGVKGARSMALSPDGILYVGTRGPGVVYVCKRQPDSTYAVLATLKGFKYWPNGVAFVGKDLYVSENERVVRFKDVDANLNKPRIEVLINNLPDKTHHGWRSITAGPGNRLYMGIGAPCNNCESDSPFATIVSFTTEGKDMRIEASGVRNTLGIAFHPTRNTMYFTENGRDMLSDSTPRDEMNEMTVRGQHFGYPYLHAGYIVDPEFGGKYKGNVRTAFKKPVALLEAHCAPLGFRFYTGHSFPPIYHGQMFVAEHGSWNRKDPIGYRITTIAQGEDGRAIYKPFASGFLKGEKAWGRPVDVLVEPSGHLLVSDDEAGVVYRIRYMGKG